jgi:hypothetical protein
MALLGDTGNGFEFTFVSWIMKCRSCCQLPVIARSSFMRSSQPQHIACWFYTLGERREIISDLWQPPIHGYSPKEIGVVKFTTKLNNKVPSETMNRKVLKGMLHCCAISWQSHELHAAEHRLYE